MNRQTGRALVLGGVAAIILSMAWWASYMNLVFRTLGDPPPIRNPFGCLLFTSEFCAQAKARASALTFPEYSAVSLWISLIILLAGLVVVARTTSPEPYPVTPADEPKLLIPALEPFYAWVRDLAWPLIRIGFAGTLFVHGYGKLTTGVVETFATGSMAGRGLEPALPLAYIVFFNEGIGTILVALGLFTRFAAASIAVEMFLLTFVGHFLYGFNFTAARGGWEMPLLWGIGFFAIALRGGGPYSLDRLIKREL